MNIQDAFNAINLKNLRATISTNTPSHNLPENVWIKIYDTLTSAGQKPTSEFWGRLYAQLKLNNKIALCVSGKHICEIVGVVLNPICAKHLGELLKRNYKILILSQKHAQYVSWDNWNQIYAQITQKDKTPTVNELSAATIRQIRKNREREKEFYELAKSARKPKVCNRISFNDARSFRIKAEHADYVSKVQYRLNKILTNV